MSAISSGCGISGKINPRQSNFWYFSELNIDFTVVANDFNITMEGKAKECIIIM